MRETVLENVAASSLVLFVSGLRGKQRLLVSIEKRPRKNGHIVDEKPGAPSSMHLVLHWLLEPGNYERWTAGREKTLLATEIVKEMERNGIKHRTPRSVYFQIYNLRRHFEHVKKWLDDRGQLELFRRGESTEQIETQVLERFPQFRKLMPLFTTSEEQEKGEEQDNSEDTSDLGSSADESRTEKLCFATMCKRKSVSNMQGASELPMIKRGKQEASKSQSQPTTPTTGPTEKQPEVQEVRVQLGVYPVSRQPWESSLGGRDDYCVILTGKVAEEVAQRVIERDLKYKEDLANCHLDEEKKREEIRTKTEQMRAMVEKMLLRNQLKLLMRTSTTKSRFSAALSDSDDGFQDFLSEGEEQETLLNQESVALERRMKTVRLSGASCPAISPGLS
ncbi:hypothetical protein ON010_g18109 [Phytophthora cinnamomi]|nr:hypothetical protein ON010_g18109 [Phytophthora cinnamomi]